MKRMSPEARVGLLVLAGLLILVYMTLKVGKLGFGPEGGYVLYLRVDNAAGVNKDSDVLVAGIPVGVLKEVRLDHQEALLSLRIQDKVRLPKDSTVSIRTHGVLGEKYIAIVPGTQSDYLKNGDYIRTSPTSADFERLVATVNAVFEDLKKVSATLSKVLGTEQGEEDLREIVAGLRDSAQGLREVIVTNREGIREAVANIRALSEGLRKIVDANAGNLTDTIANARKFSETLTGRGISAVENMDRFAADMNAVIAENRENLRVTLANLREGTAKLSKALDDASGFFADARNPDGTIGKLMRDGALYEEMRGAVGGLQSVLGRMERGEGTLGKLLSDDTLYTELRGSMENLRGISEKINQGQGTLGKLVNDQSVHENLNTTLTGINDFVAGGNRFRFEPSFWGEYLFDKGETRSYANLDIWPRPDRFYRLGLVWDPWGKITTKRTKTVDEETGEVISDEEETKTKDKFKFSAQMGKRFSFLTLRGGLIESTAGAAIDAQFWDDRLRLTVEASDFAGDQGGPHIKGAARWDFWNHFFVTGGADAFTGDDGHHTDVFLGGGIHFFDDDLKYIFSSMGALAK